MRIHCLTSEGAFMLLTAFKKFLLCGIFTIMIFGSAAGHAQNSGETLKRPMEHARDVATHCVGAWESQTCMTHVSDSVLYMAADYAARLQDQNKEVFIEDLKQHCAAATAATQQDVPAYAMQSALTTCANIITTLNEESGVSPNRDMFQLLVGAVLCLDKDERCAQIEQGLKNL